MVQCPQCESEATVKNGHIHNGKQGYLCKDCGRQFVPAATKKVIAADTKGAALRSRIRQRQERHDV